MRTHNKTLFNSLLNVMYPYLDYYDIPFIVG